MPLALSTRFNKRRFLSIFDQTPYYLRVNQKSQTSGHVSFDSLLYKWLALGIISHSAHAVAANRHLALRTGLLRDGGF